MLNKILKRFIQIRNENQADTKVIVIHALCKQNYTQIEKMVIQSRDLGVDELRFQLMQPVCSELHEQLPNHSELVWIKQTIENLLENKTQGKMVVEANINWQLERKDERLVRDSPEIKSGVWKRSAKPTTLPEALDLEKTTEQSDKYHIEKLKRIPCPKTLLCWIFRPTKLCRWKT